MNNTFLNGDLQEDACLFQLEGFMNKEKPQYVCKIKRLFMDLNKLKEHGFLNSVIVLFNKGLSASILIALCFYLKLKLTW